MGNAAVGTHTKRPRIFELGQPDDLMLPPTLNKRVTSNLSIGPINRVSLDIFIEGCKLPENSRRMSDRQEQLFGLADPLPGGQKTDQNQQIIKAGKILGLQPLAPSNNGNAGKEKQPNFRIGITEVEEEQYDGDSYESSRGILEPIPSTTTLCGQKIRINSIMNRKGEVPHRNSANYFKESFSQHDMNMLARVSQNLKASKSVKVITFTRDQRNSIETDSTGLKDQCCIFACLR